MISLERNLKCLEHKPVKIFNVTFKTEKARTVHTKQKFCKFKSNDNLRIKKQKQCKQTCKKELASLSKYLIRKKLITHVYYRLIYFPGLSS